MYVIWCLCPANKFAYRRVAEKEAKGLTNCLPGTQTAISPVHTHKKTTSTLTASF